ncbi:uncharacterized protein ASPGLDRAFT_52314 [Aspergillus glaucus CBS 516.65]|uniref:Uncharacterized protein n=1 Tax=Aspergillus glaucus CBS 516.65 TaxID=1160497 RepID=A0A1L9V783_ASPGL|nr:hypothetical protein ASPGLDRAFT_52314 [Aspergillus glaucus CBS 516.65]OJJ79778.1 hypothetical protein ASPGLDRAFT_52314 [Aspergillus glaucus CBS 516.65]
MQRLIVVVRYADATAFRRYHDNLGYLLATKYGEKGASGFQPMTPGTGLSESTTFTVPDTVPIEELQVIRLGEGLHPVVIQVL